MNIFLKKNKKQKLIILDIPLLLENKINKKNDILIFVKSSKKHVLNKLKRRNNFNADLLKRFKKIQLSLDYKRKKSQFIINNDFTQKTVMKYIKFILKKVSI